MLGISLILYTLLRTVVIFAPASVFSVYFFTAQTTCAVPNTEDIRGSVVEYGDSTQHGLSFFPSSGIYNLGVTLLHRVLFEKCHTNTYQEMYPW